MTNAKFQIQEIFQIKKVYGKPFKAYQAGNTPYVTGKQTDNGCIGHVCAPATDISKGNCISVDPITGLCCYQPVDFVGRGFSGASINLLYNDKMDDVNALYLCASIQKRASAVAAYTNLFNSDKLATAIITLPVVPSSDPSHTYTPADIDWQYMRDRITELERDRITELERDRITELDAYLKATGLDDYELTENDIHSLSLSTKATSDEEGTVDGDCGIRKKEFRIGDLFDIHPTNAYKMSNKGIFDIPGNIPVLSNSSVNNGICGYCGRPATEHGNIITFSDTTTGGDTMFYQPDPFIGYPHVQGMYPRKWKEYWNEAQLQYVIALTRKAAGDGWSYANKFNRKLVADLKISLPVTSSGEPDWDYMEKYIRAIEKVVIADVVKWKDKEIEATKKIVNKAV